MSDSRKPYLIGLVQREISPSESIPLKIFSLLVYVMIMAVIIMGFIGDEMKWGLFLMIGVVVMSLIVYGAGFFSDSKSNAALIPWGIFEYNAPSLDISLGFFVFSYMMIGMSKSGNFNIILIILYSAFLVIASALKIALRDSSFGHLSVSALMGLLLGGLYGLIIMITDKNNLIFANTDVGTEKCGYTRKRNFKCSVYKNGVLLKNL